MASILSSRADIGALGMDKAIHKFTERNKINIDLKLGTSLVDTCMQNVGISRIPFKFYTAWAVLTWSSMIIGLASHGPAMVALEFFSKMIEHGNKPNDINFVGVFRVLVTTLGLSMHG